MQGDFERVTFDPADAFANVLIQQGRLLLPADFNELGAILQHAMRQFIVDLQGNEWQVGKGFDIDVTSGTTLTFKIKQGRFYVDGIRCENAKDIDYNEQPFWQTPDDLGSLVGDHVIVYLHCWERHVTWLQNGRLRDVALGGPDTATRVQIAWQVRAESTALAEELKGIGDALREQLNAGGDKATLGRRIKAVDDLLKAFGSGMTEAQADAVLDEIDGSVRAFMAADAKQDAPNPDPCAIASDAEYRGRENQLYRIEVHQPGTAQKATLKWSRENGSVAFRVLDVVVGDKDEETHVTLESLGHDRRTGVFEGDWVELIDDDLEFSWASSPLLHVRSVDIQRRVVTLRGKAALQPHDPDRPDRHAILRRWDHRSTDKSTGALAVDDTTWMELERGIKVRFTKGGFYRKGDYWLIPARVATGDIEWPTDDEGAPRSIEPNGITHHRAVLTLVTKEKGTWTGKQ